MRYFTYIAEQAFKTSPKGERLFYQGGPWSRPYIIPDQATEQRLYKKQVWLMRIFLGGLILGQPFLFVYLPDLIKQPLTFLIYFFGLMALYHFVTRAVFAEELDCLQQLDKPLGLGQFYAQIAQRHSKGKLLLGCLGSLAFVAGGAWMLADGENILISVLCIGFFSLTAVAWSYALYLKFKTDQHVE